MSNDLSPAHCILLTVHYASSANITALHSFTPTRPDALDPELVLRILLTYLPESTDPREYIKYVEEVGSRLYLDYDRQDVEVDTSPIQHLSSEQAQKKVKKLHLPELTAPSFPKDAPKDLLTRFLCHRAYRIDHETGLLNLIPHLIEPFLARNEYIRTWYISVVLPVLRLQLEYYPQDGTIPEISLSDFEKLDGRQGLDFLLVKGEQEAGKLSDADSPTDGKRNTIARDVKGLVGPWMYGHTERKRRKLSRTPKHPSSAQGEASHDHDNEKNDDTDQAETNIKKIALDGITAADKTGHDWEYMYQWLVAHAVDHFPRITACIEAWDGPGDIDLGGLDDRSGAVRPYLDEDVQRKLELQYAQAAFAACYAVQADTAEVVRGAHGVLARLAELLDFIPPPDLATSVDSLPKIERHATVLDASQTVADLAPEELLAPEHPLTTPRLETYMLLQMMVYSAYQFAGLGHPLSLVSVAKLHFYAEGDEQLAVLRKILAGLAQGGGRRDEAEWTADRAKLLWLWNWGIAAEDAGTDQQGAGVLGKIDRREFEEEMLKGFVETSCYELATRLFITAQPGESSSRRRGLPLERVEQVVLAKAMEAYDGASNGNKMRGGVRKASEIIAAFRPHFRNSAPFRQASSLISATHALSFYALTLQHGVPFKPVSIRVASDPIALVDKVLEQNPHSYTQLDDLIAIAQNLVSAGLPPTEDADGVKLVVSGEELGRRLKVAERRVTFMAVEAALREDDFETAYSYIVNRLTPSGADIAAPQDGKTAKNHGRNANTRPKHQPNDSENADDISWRAAFLAGRYRSPTTSTPPPLRRLEQRTELLSLALLLAPTAALTEILAVWRRCEEETTSLQLSQQQAEREFDDRADKRIASTGSSSALPGHFLVGGEQPEMVLNQKRREMGRMGAAGNSTAAGGPGGKVGDGAGAPMSMFDLTRSAARAFSRNAFPLHNTTATNTTLDTATSRSAKEGEEHGDMTASTDSLGSEAGGVGELNRLRKRDMVANAVSGGLASGLGWVLGAQPVGEREG
ncbi:hypothetical protein LTR36_009585 [Oleoguttula mirabilis]|uniref:Sec39 domain-containing protein n=1 Tax=Oleoguttula mirabilis TaxID=1507867 RepID=A0AAV9JT57_9PEZI|nr:hypothetical protein LTR36_009585 [Oleoguttula mirabilis]